MVQAYSGRGSASVWSKKARGNPIAINLSRKAWFEQQLSCSGLLTAFSLRPETG
jgi:hypothetical protein